MQAIFDEDVACYPFIAVFSGEKEGESRTITLKEAADEQLAGLPLTKGEKDPVPTKRYKRALEMRFGIGTKPLTFANIGREIGGVSGERVRQIIHKALRMLRHPSRSRSLHRFLVPLPEEIGRERWRREECGRRFQKLEEENKRLLAANRGLIKHLRQADDMAAFTAFMAFITELREWAATKVARRALTRAMNGLRRGEVKTISQLEELLDGKTGRIRQIRHVGEKSERLIREKLAEFKQRQSERAAPQKEPPDYFIFGPLAVSSMR